MTFVIPFRFRTGDQSRQSAIVLALLEHGVRVRPGEVGGVEEFHLELPDPSGRTVRRSVTEILDRAVPGWEHDVSIHWPE